MCYQNKDRLMAGIIVGGYDPIEGGAVYSIPLGYQLLEHATGFFSFYFFILSLLSAGGPW